MGTRISLSTFLQLVVLLGLTSAVPHSTPYSLQAAVDALHRRESQLSSADERGRETNFDDSEGLGHRALSHVLSNYLARDNFDQRLDERNMGDDYLPEFDERDQFFDDDEYGPDDKKKKRSMFREREEQQPSVFREREYGHPSTLDEDFLREMDRERNIDRDQKYHALIKQLWGKYKHDDEDLERQLLRNEYLHARGPPEDDDNYPDMSEEEDDYYKKKRSMKRKRMMFAPMFGYPSAITAGYYGGGPAMAPGPVVYDKKKKRGYPILPWLPASRKKRFPVAKRSPAPDEFQGMTDEKVARDLKEIFGGSEFDDKKKKRSSGVLFGLDKKRSVPEETEEDKKKRMAVKKSENLEEEKKKKSVKKSVEEEDKKKRTVKKSEDFGDDDDKKKRAKKDEFDDSNDDDDKKKKRAKKDEIIDDSDDDKKKKRSVKRKRNTDCDEDYCEPHDHYVDSEEDESEDSDEMEDDGDEDNEDDEERRRRKKKRDVKKRKRANMEILREEQIIPGDLMDMKKRDINWAKTWGVDRRKKSSGSSSRDYPLSFYKNYEQNRRQNLDLSKIDNMDQKLKTIEDLLIDETIKYTGAHEGIVEPEDIKELKDHVVSRLATAYNLEKMRHSLDKIKNNIENEDHLSRNEIPDDSDDKKAKRVAVKKEKVEFDHSGHKPEDEPKKVEHEEPENDMEDDEDKKKKKKKRNGLEDLLEESGVPLDTLEDQCTILDNLEKRCKGVDALSGDLHQELLPACGVHQLCYLCGTSQSECDFQYLADAETICGHHAGCQSAARSALMILRGFPSPTLGPRECAKNPCLYQALKDIGV
uniref:CSON015037 protein n=1 Tax=Culicoides sonorensis TaxID=179676 RepID=A0A336LNG4_CULSO